MQLTWPDHTEGIRRIAEELRKSSFVSIDYEFTGLYVRGGSQSQKFLDTPDERYLKTKSAASSFYVNQLGLSIFTWDNKSSSYKTNTVSSYIFQRQTPDANVAYRSFLSDPASLEFLSKHNFDFNKWVYEGVPYLRKDHEEKILLRDFEKGLEDLNFDPKLRPLLLQGLQRIASWIVHSFNEPTVVDAQSKICASIINDLLKKYAGISVEVNGYYMGLSNNIGNLDEGTECPVANIKKLVGVRAVIDSIIEFKVPLVLHNGFLDLAHTYEKFIAPLPNTLQEFKDSVSGMFGCIFDTKHLFNVSKIEMTSSPNLSAITDELKNEKYMYPVIGDLFPGKDHSAPSYHDASYDAAVTGFVFLKLMGYINRCEKSQKLDLSPEVNEKISHRLAVARSDISYLNLIGDDEVSPRDDIFVVYNFSAKTTHNDVCSEFPEETYGPRHVQWHSDQLLYLRILSDNKKRTMEELCSRSPISGEGHLFNYSVARYCDYKAIAMKDDHDMDGVVCTSVDRNGQNEQTAKEYGASPLKKKRRLGDATSDS